jgi:hypothetical protein
VGASGPIPVAPAAATVTSHISLYASTYRSYYSHYRLRLRSGSFLTSPTSSEHQHPYEPLLVEAHEIFLHVSTALSNTFAYDIWLGNFNINHFTWGGAGVRPDQSSQLHFSLQEQHDLSLLLPPGTTTFIRHDAQSTMDLVFSSSSLSKTLMACCSREDQDHGSDHFHIKS